MNEGDVYRVRSNPQVKSSLSLRNLICKVPFRKVGTFLQPWTRPSPGSYLDVLLALCGERHESRHLLHGCVVGHAVHGAAGLAAAGHAVLAAAHPVLQTGRPRTHVAISLARGAEIIFPTSKFRDRLCFLCLFLENV